jgi:hypothetical protein
MRRIGAILALLWSGCSLGFVAGPPPEHAQVASFQCTDSKLAPILDSVFGGLFGLTFLAAASQSDEMWANDSNNSRLGSRTEVAVLYGSLAALEAASAYYGYITVRRCRAARREVEERVQSGLQRLPPNWPPGPPGAQPGPPPAPPPAAPPPGDRD